MTIRLFTDRDREAMRHAKEERRVLDALDHKYAVKGSAEPIDPPLRTFHIDPRERS